MDRPGQAPQDASAKAPSEDRIETLIHLDAQAREPAGPDKPPIPAPATNTAAGEEPHAIPEAAAVRLPAQPSGKPPDAGRQIVAVLAADVDFQHRGLALPLKKALREWLADIVARPRSPAADSPPASVTVAVIDGDRTVRTLVSPSDLASLAALDEAARRDRLVRLASGLQFTARSLQPVADSYPLYEAFHGPGIAAIVYVVAGTRIDFSPRFTGPLYTWLFEDRIPLTIASLGPCAEWRRRYATLGAGLSCVELHRGDPAARLKDALARALQGAAQPAFVTGSAGKTPPTRQPGKPQ